jgi:hypothetical protein
MPTHTAASTRTADANHQVDARTARCRRAPPPLRPRRRSHTDAYHRVDSRTAPCRRRLPRRPQPPRGRQYAATPTPTTMSTRAGALTPARRPQSPRRRQHTNTSTATPTATPTPAWRHVDAHRQVQASTLRHRRPTASSEPARRYADAHRQHDANCDVDRRMVLRRRKAIHWLDCNVSAGTAFDVDGGEIWGVRNGLQRSVRCSWLCHGLGPWGQGLCVGVGRGPGWEVYKPRCVLLFPLSPSCPNTLRKTPSSRCTHRTTPTCPLSLITTLACCRQDHCCLHCPRHHCLHPRCSPALRPPSSSPPPPWSALPSRPLRPRRDVERLLTLILHPSSALVVRIMRMMGLRVRVPRLPNPILGMSCPLHVGAHS